MISSLPSLQISELVFLVIVNRMYLSLNCTLLESNETIQLKYCSNEAYSSQTN